MWWEVGLREVEKRRFLLRNERPSGLRRIPFSVLLLHDTIRELG